MAHTVKPALTKQQYHYLVHVQVYKASGKSDAEYSAAQVIDSWTMGYGKKILFKK